MLNNRSGKDMDYIEELIAENKKKFEEKLFTEESREKAERGKGKLKLKGMDEFFSTEAILYLMVSYWLEAIVNDSIDIDIDDMNIDFLENYEEYKDAPEFNIILISMVIVYAGASGREEMKGVWINKIDHLFKAVMVKLMMHGFSEVRQMVDCIEDSDDELTMAAQEMYMMGELYHEEDTGFAVEIVWEEGYRSFYEGVAEGRNIIL